MKNTNLVIKSDEKYRNLTTEEVRNILANDTLKTR